MSRVRLIVIELRTQLIIINVNVAEKHTHSCIVFAQMYAHILPQAINAILIYCSLLSAKNIGP